MNFVSYNQLVKDCKALAREIENVDCIIGIPRSGVLPASLLALELNCKLAVTTHNNLLILTGGDRDNGISNNCLIIDDSTDSGKTLDYFHNLFPNYQCMAIYGSLDSKYASYKKVENPRVFEWNLMSSATLNYTCMDIDGILCDDHTSTDINYLRSLKAHYKPKFAVHSLVTGRLEEYREVTEQWLGKNNIVYNNLIMRKSDKTPAEVTKANYYKTSDCTLFIESSDFQAKEIFKRTKRPVLAFENMKFYENTQQAA